MSQENQRITPSALLAWSVINSQTEREDRTINRPMDQIDPKWIEIIMGKPDSARMIECIKAIVELQDLEKRLLAFDELELLVESLDNSNDLQPLKQWPILIALLLDPVPEIRLNTCWVIATAVQNNPKTQLDFARHDGVVKIMGLIEREQDRKVKLKAVYCLSSAIRQSKTCFEIFMKHDGVRLCKDVCASGEDDLIKRVMFFLACLLRDEMVDESGAASLVGEKVLQEMVNHDLVLMIMELLPICSSKDVEDFISFLTEIFSSQWSSTLPVSYWGTLQGKLALLRNFEDAAVIEKLATLKQLSIKP